MERRQVKSKKKEITLPKEIQTFINEEIIKPGVPVPSKENLLFILDKYPEVAKHLKNIFYSPELELSDAQKTELIRTICFYSPTSLFPPDQIIANLNDRVGLDREFRFEVDAVKTSTDTVEALFKQFNARLMTVYKYEDNSHKFDEVAKILGREYMEKELDDDLKASIMHKLQHVATGIFTPEKAAEEIKAAIEESLEEKASQQRSTRRRPR